MHSLDENLSEFRNTGARRKFQKEIPGSERRNGKLGEGMGRKGKRPR
jgi:hypothetical protein